MTTFCISDKNGLPLDLDIGGDLAELKKNLAKFKKGKHGKGLDDIDIEELDFVSGACKDEYYFYNKEHKGLIFSYWLETQNIRGQN